MKPNRSGSQEMPKSGIPGAPGRKEEGTKETDVDVFGSCWDRLDWNHWKAQGGGHIEYICGDKNGPGETQEDPAPCWIKQAQEL